MSNSIRPPQINFPSTVANEELPDLQIEVLEDVPVAFEEEIEAAEVIETAYILRGMADLHFQQLRNVLSDLSESLRQQRQALAQVFAEGREEHEQISQAHQERWAVLVRSDEEATRELEEATRELEEATRAHEEVTQRLFAELANNAVRRQQDLEAYCRRHAQEQEEFRQLNEQLAHVDEEVQKQHEEKLQKAKEAKMQARLEARRARREEPWHLPNGQTMEEAVRSRQTSTDSQRVEIVQQCLKELRGLLEQLRGLASKLSLKTSSTNNVVKSSHYGRMFSSSKPTPAKSSTQKDLQEAPGLTTTFPKCMR